MNLKNLFLVIVDSDWTEIDPLQMMSVYYYPNRRWQDGVSIITDDPIYSGQTLQLSCYTSPYYFSDGTRWAIRYKNQTMKILGETLYLHYVSAILLWLSF